MDKFKLSARFESGAYNAWIEYNKLAAITKPLNLGQGFPDYEPPARITNFLTEVASEKNPLFYQYTRGMRAVFLPDAIEDMLRRKTIGPLSPRPEPTVSEELPGQDFENECGASPGLQRIRTCQLSRPPAGSVDLVAKITNNSGHPRLVNVLAKLYSRLVDREIDPMQEVMVTVGGYEALYCAVQSNIDEGDEAIIIEPFFDCYEPLVRIAGGTPRFIPLRNTKPNSIVSRSSDWKLDPDELASLFNAKTKLIILNTPHNPLGKIFDYDELTMIGDLAKKHNVLVISDEVYEWLVYEPSKHIRIASLPDMWERTITIGSAGKTFSMTGWKLGWAYGPANIMRNLAVVHQTAIHTCATAVQEAVARGFEREFNLLYTPDCYFQNLPSELKPKMEYLWDILQTNGFKPIIPEGGYFMVADWSQLENKLDLSSEPDKYKDMKFTKWMSKNIKFQCMPFSIFFSENSKPTAVNYTRFCFFKKDETLNKAQSILSTWTRNL